MSTPREQKSEQHSSHHSVGKTLTYVGTVILLIIVVVAFVGTPAVGGIAGGNRINFGSYAGRDIEYQPGNYLARQYQDLAARVQQQDQEITESLVRQIWRTAFQRAVYHEALMVLAEDAGVSVSTRAVDRAVARWPEFQVDGRFSSEEFNATSSQYRLALRDYLKEALIDAQVQTDLYGETTPSEAERAFLVGLAGPERQFSFVQFSFTDFPDEEVIAYGEQNANRFQRMNLSVISINSSESDAEQIREQAVSRQASFEDLARNQSVDVYSDDAGEMGWVYYHELEPDFEDTSVIDEIFALEDGEISRVFETTFGWTIYRANEPALEPDFTDANTILAVRDYLTVFERGLVEDYLRTRADGFVEAAREQGFESASSAIDQVPALTSYFPVNYGNTPYFGTVNAASNQAIATGAYQEEFFETLFALEEGDVSEPVVLRDFVFVFELADEREPEEDTVDFLDSYVSLIVRELVQQQVQQTVIRDDLLVDNFNTTYNRTIAGN